MELDFECNFCKFRGTQIEDLFSSEHVCKEYDCEVWIPLQPEEAQASAADPQTSIDESTSSAHEDRGTCYEASVADMDNHKANKPLAKMKSPRISKPKLSPLLSTMEKIERVHKKRGRKPKN